MYTVGEFAHLAHVSKRQLRYYDEIGLFKPDQIDPTSAYRYYSAGQMSHLNRILALKELGLTLNQIQRSLADDVSTDELHGMLKLRKAEIEQQLDAELRRIREIEARLESIHNDEANMPPNVIIKQVPDIAVFSVRLTLDDFETAVDFYTRMQSLVPRPYKNGQFYCICRSNTDSIYNLDLEFGVYANKSETAPLLLTDNITLIPSTLSAESMMATTVVTGALETIHRGYAELTRWSMINGYQLNGIHRELCLQMATQADGNDMITEIQVPVESLPLGTGLAR